MNQNQRTFTLEEANSLLPELESLLASLETKQEIVRQLHDEIFFEELLENDAPPDTRLQELEATLVRMEEEIQRIRTLGCRLRSPREGLIDFLSQRDAEWVYYCWKRGEKEIRFYHTLRGGFLERKPI